MLVYVNKLNALLMLYCIVICIFLCINLHMGQPENTGIAD